VTWVLPSALVGGTDLPLIERDLIGCRRVCQVLGVGSYCNCHCPQVWPQFRWTVNLVLPQVQVDTGATLIAWTGLVFQADTGVTWPQWKLIIKIFHLLEC
jgi:hypothetical protein